MSKPPRTEREAEYRSHRKLRALKRRAFDLLCGANGIAGMWEEGAVSSDIDALMDAIDTGITAIELSMADEIDRHEEDLT